MFQIVIRRAMQTKDFNYWKTLHDSQSLEEFSECQTGLLWLKTKSIIRKELLAAFLTQNQINLQGTSSAKQFIELFELFSQNTQKSHTLLNKFIRTENEKQAKKLDVDQLVLELYKLKNFEWGGDYQNSLDKYLVSRYVKVHQSYEKLVSKFDLEINAAVQGYVLSSWYNHWSSILIEHIFKSHEAVLPAVGQIKSVDFFIDDIPFDLKVTYLPTEYIKSKRKEKGYPVELTYLKSKAKQESISYDNNSSPNNIAYQIIEQMKDRNNDACIEILNTIKNQKLEILKEAQESPKALATWLYENQGEMRFGSENRLFLVLVDTDDFNNSWKLKRNLELLKPTIISYLSELKSKKKDNMKINFSYKGKSQVFKAISDVIFVIK